MQAAVQKITAAALMLLAAAWLAAAGLTAVPPLTAPVMDNAQMMSAAARAELDTHLRRYAQETGSQIAVLTVPAVAPETPFDYALRVMDAWQLGRSGVDDGVLLLLVRDERKTYLAVGRGLEGAIPDVYAKRILEDVLRPYLQQGRIDEGIGAAVAQVEKLIAGEGLPAAEYAADDGGGAADIWGLLLMVPVFAGGLLKAWFGRTWGSAAAGGLVGGLIWWFGWAWWAALAAGAVGALLTFILGSGAFVSGGGGGFGHGGGFGNRGGSGGRSHGGWRSGGGFRGGGGGFGGGGASGGW
ncbi:TPM domain-containing protein [Bergeriella denitrificans]|uniref:Domain of uncharacterized function (DUF477) n=1 Tax=Bergeriella denitrificans TaxID=494 RepID=A0A378UGH6_BERDE|nr:TPM domain-containing protein [Bergeriella denitrificans]STZ76405.1 Domain of uncharacterised function (DUF477) [Bergeriella denitrificans]